MNLNNLCLCDDPINDISSCYTMFGYELVYNISGTENNGEYDNFYDSFGFDCVHKSENIKKYKLQMNVHNIVFDKWMKIESELF